MVGILGFVSINISGINVKSDQAGLNLNEAEAQQHNIGTAQQHNIGTDELVADQEIASEHNCTDDGCAEFDAQSEIVDATISTKNQIENELPAIIYLTGTSEHQSMEDLSDAINGEIKCMAENIYWEARNQSKLGMIAVGRVVVNRVRSKNYPDTVCGVILQGPKRESWKTRQHKHLKDSERRYYPVRNRCQFSWYCDGQNDEVRRGERDIFTTAWHIASAIVLDNRWEGFIGGATHYHADYVAPSWRHELVVVSKIDDHIFYRP